MTLNGVTAQFDSFAGLLRHSSWR